MKGVLEMLSSIKTGLEIVSSFSIIDQEWPAIKAMFKNGYTLAILMHKHNN